MPPFIIQPLSSEQLLSVYPLVREAVPSLERVAWVRFARQLTSARRANPAGIVAAWRQGRNFPCGLFCYRVDNDLQRGRILIAEHFVAVDLLNPQAVLAALVAELEALAVRLDCAAVRSVLHGDSEVTGGLCAAGHVPEGSLLLKPILPCPSKSRRGAQKSAKSETAQRC